VAEVRFEQSSVSSVEILVRCNIFTSSHLAAIVALIIVRVSTSLDESIVVSHELWSAERNLFWDHFSSVAPDTSGWACSS
jgi:hypothetical protein